MGKFFVCKLAQPFRRTVIWEPAGSALRLFDSGKSLKLFVDEKLAAQRRFGRAGAECIVRRAVTNWIWPSVLLPRQNSEHSPLQSRTHRCRHSTAGQRQRSTRGFRCADAARDPDEKRWARRASIVVEVFGVSLEVFLRSESLLSVRPVPELRFGYGKSVPERLPHDEFGDARGSASMASPAPRQQRRAEGSVDGNLVTQWFPCFRKSDSSVKP